MLFSSCGFVGAIYSILPDVFYICRMNYFELFQIPVGPVVDKAIISRNYIALQKNFHPDYFTESGEWEQDEVLQKSADINKAYKIFQDADKTIEYFLQLSGLIEVDEKYNLPNEFLMEIMEINETLGENPEAAKNEVTSLKEKLDIESKNITDNYWLGVTDGESFQHMKLNYYKKKYLKRILERLEL